MRKFVGLWKNISMLSVNQSHSLNSFYNEHSSNSICVHSDLIKVMNIIPKGIREQAEIFNIHYELIRKIADERDIFFPTYNYDFTKSKEYFVKNSKAQIGFINESYRTRVSSWRTFTPIFNYAGNSRTKNKVSKFLTIERQIIDPFDNDSFFKFLYDNNSTLVMYGTDLSNSFTGIYFLEHLAGRPLYRYDKFFKGKIFYNDNEYLVNLKYHVRPLNIYQKYDYEKLENLAFNNNLIKIIRVNNCEIRLAPFRELCDFFLEFLKRDPYFLLDKKSKEIYEPMINKLGRRFILSDFENEEISE